MKIQNEIDYFQHEFQNMIERQRGLLLLFSKSELGDLIHQCEDLRTHEDYTMRVSAEVNKACATIILEERDENTAKKV